MKKGRQTLVLRSRWALGDTVCLSALVRDVALAYPGQFDLKLTGHYANVFWRNNPHCEGTAAAPAGRLVNLEYLPGIHAAGRGQKVHFLSWFHHDFKKKTGLHVPVTLPRGDIHLTAQEGEAKIPGRYWVVVAGGKRDMTAKVWAPHSWQRTVDVLKKYGVRCVQAGADFHNHFHPTLDNVERVVGATDNERAFFSLIANAEGVICGITAAMHVAAAFQKPCVVIAGGREEPWWEAYSNAYFPTSFGPTCAPVAVEHEFLHTVGLLDCKVNDNLVKGCWRDRTVPLEQADRTHPAHVRRLCRKPTTVGGYAVPACLKMIEPDHVIEAVMRYYENGVLPPIGTPTRKYSLPVVNVDPAEPGTDRTVVAEVKVAKGEVVSVSTENVDFAPLADRRLGGKVTICVLGYGDHLHLLKRCLGSILDTVPRQYREVRLALNQPSKEMLAYATGFPAEDVRKLYVDGGERRKYPAMREMFQDHDRPIATPYVLWFDDDSWAADPLWLPRLARTIGKNHDAGCRLYGARFVHDLVPYRRQGRKPEKWFQAAPWWKGKHLHTAGGLTTAPNGSQIVFASGGFWAMASHLIYDAGIPDARLNHNGGDITIGAQVTQAGFKVYNFDPSKKHVRWSDAPRRGFRENFPWAA